LGNSVDNLRHTRSVAYSVELVLLNKHQILSSRVYLHVTTNCLVAPWYDMYKVCFCWQSDYSNCLKGFSGDFLHKCRTR